MCFSDSCESFSVNTTHARLTRGSCLRARVEAGREQRGQGREVCRRERQDSRQFLTFLVTVAGTRESASGRSRGVT